MQLKGTLQQIVLKSLAFFLALLVLFSGAERISPAFAEEADPDSGEWDDFFASEEFWDGWDDSGDGWDSWDDSGDSWDGWDDWDESDWDEFFASDEFWEGFEGEDGWDGDFASDEFPAGFEAEDDWYDVTTEGGMAVFNAKNEAYLREDDKDDPDLDEDEYLSYYVNIKNTDPDDLREQPATYRIDGGIEKSFSDVSLTEGGATQYHVDMKDMAELNPGLHEIEVFVNNEWVRTDRFYITRDWDEIMPEPTEAQINEIEHNARSPYIVYYPSFETSSGFSEYAIDLSIDKMDKGTYVSTVCGAVDISKLKDKGITLRKNYGDPGGDLCRYSELG